MEVVGINGQSLTKVKSVGLRTLDPGIKMQMSTALRSGFRLEPIQQNFAIPFRAVPFIRV